MLLNDCKDFGLAVYTGKTKYIELGRRKKFICVINDCKDFGLAVYTGKTKFIELGRHRGIIGQRAYRGRSNSNKPFKYLGSL